MTDWFTSNTVSLPRAALAVALILGALLAGCTSQSSEPAVAFTPEPAAQLPPLPADIQDSRPVARHADPGYINVGPPIPRCNSDDHCIHYEVQVNTTVVLAARLTWTDDKNDLDLHLLNESGDAIASSINNVPAHPVNGGPALEEIAIELEPGYYELLVAALIVTTQDIYTLDAVFTRPALEVPEPAGNTTDPGDGTADQGLPEGNQTTTSDLPRIRFVECDEFGVNSGSFPTALLADELPPGWSADDETGLGALATAIKACQDTLVDGQRLGPTTLVWVGAFVKPSPEYQRANRTSYVVAYSLQVDNDAVRAALQSNGLPVGPAAVNIERPYDREHRGPRLATVEGDGWGLQLIASTAPESEAIGGTSQYALRAFFLDDRAVVGALDYDSGPNDRAFVAGGAVRYSGDFASHVPFGLPALWGNSFQVGPDRWLEMTLLPLGDLIRGS